MIEFETMLWCIRTTNSREGFIVTVKKRNLAIFTNPKPTIFHNLYENTVTGMIIFEIRMSNNLSRLSGPSARLNPCQTGHLSGTSFPDGELDVVYWLQKFKQNGHRLYCSYQLDSNFHLFIFSWRDLKNLITVVAIHFFSVTNWLYTTRQSDEGVKTSHWCLACFFNRQLVNRGRDRLTMLTKPLPVNYDQAYNRF